VIHPSLKILKKIQRVFYKNSLNIKTQVEPLLPFLSLKTVGLKLKYQFDEELIDTYISSKHKNNKADEQPAKKLKLNNRKKISILEYSCVQLPLVPFIDYLEKYSKTFVDQCLTYNNSNETSD